MGSHSVYMYDTGETETSVKTFTSGYYIPKLNQITRKLVNIKTVF